MASVCTDMPVAFQPLDFPSRLVHVKASPTFTSCDLFTPFSAPRATLPTIGEFVRPTYGKANTWGTATVSYAGVGPAVAHVKEREKGSVSRSHRHYGTGCTNYHAPQQPYSVTELSLSQCRPCDQLLPKPLLTDEVVRRRQKQEYPREAAFTSHISKFAVFPSAFANESGSGTEVLSQRTAENLKKLYTTLYCTTSYKKDYKHYFVHKGSKNPPYFSLSSDSHNSDTLENKSSTVESVDSEGELKTNGDDSNEICDGLENRDSEAAVETATDDDFNKSDLGADIACTNTSDPLDEEFCIGEEDCHDKTTDHANCLPELPVQFRKISPQYTRNRCSTLSGHVPTYFFRKHQLLPSSITLLPEGFKLKPEAGEREGDRPSSSGSVTSSEDAATDDGARKGIPVIQENAQKNRLVALPRGANSGKASSENCKDRGEHTDTFQLPSVKKDLAPVPRHGRNTTKMALPTPVSNKQGIAPLSCLLSPSGSRIPHRLGLRFKAQAHTRYHNLHPDSVPDLRESRRSGKRYFFYNYHASVFRG